MFRVARVLVPFAVLMLACVASGQMRDRPQLEPADAARAFELAEELSAADGGALWGVKLYGPTIIADPVTRFAVANEPDDAGVLKAQDDLFVGTLPDNVLVANTGINWGGKRWSMLVWPLPDGRYARGRLLMHEAFHRIQEQLSIPALSPTNGHLDTLDGRLWMQLEWRALTEALLRTGEGQKSAIMDALTFRAVRSWMMMGPAMTEERQLELNEGLAEYTGVVLSGLPASAWGAHAASALEQREQFQSFSRNFAYVTGPAYGLLLDQFAPGWRKKLTSESRLDGLLAEAVGYVAPAGGESALAEQARARIGRYEGEHLLTVEEARESRRLERQSAWKKRFIDGPVLIARVGENFNFNFNPNGVEAYDQDRAVYSPVRCSDDWGVLQVPGEALIVRSAGRVVEVRVPAPTDVSARQGNGWTLTLAEGWTLKAGERQGDVIIVKN